jgi:hypothetical protein
MELADAQPANDSKLTYDLTSAGARRRASKRGVDGA